MLFSVCVRANNAPYSYANIGSIECELSLYVGIGELQRYDRSGVIGTEVDSYVITCPVIWLLVCLLQPHSHLSITVGIVIVIPLKIMSTLLFLRPQSILLRTQLSLTVVLFSHYNFIRESLFCNLCWTLSLLLLQHNPRELNQATRLSLNINHYCYYEIYAVQFLLD